MYTNKSINTNKESNGNNVAQKKNSSTALSLPAVPVLQKQQPVIQKKSFEDFDTYDEAKSYSDYSQDLLDTQKDDPIGDHFKEPFTPEQQEEIYAVNKATHESEEIISDGDNSTELYKTKTDTLAHIDHRFPKSKGGTNDYTNAAVITAKVNMKKSNKLEISKEPTKSLAPYEFLALDSAFGEGKVGAYREFSTEQRKAILNANSLYYTGVTSDDDKTTKLSRIDTASVPHVDHITAKAEGGTNYYFNAMVLPASENIKKSGAKGRNNDIDYEYSKMSLVKYYEKKEAGDIIRPAIEENDDAY